MRAFACGTLRSGGGTVQSEVRTGLQNRRDPLRKNAGAPRAGSRRALRRRPAAVARTGRGEGGRLHAHAAPAARGAASAAATKLPTMCANASGSSSCGQCPLRLSTATRAPGIILASFSVLLTGTSLSPGGGRGGGEGGRAAMRGALSSNQPVCRGGGNARAEQRARAARAPAARRTRAVHEQHRQLVLRGRGREPRRQARVLHAAARRLARARVRRVGAGPAHAARAEAREQEAHHARLPAAHELRQAVRVDARVAQLGGEWVGAAGQGRVGRGALAAVARAPARGRGGRAEQRRGGGARIHPSIHLSRAPAPPPPAPWPCRSRPATARCARSRGCAPRRAGRGARAGAAAG